MIDNKTVLVLGAGASMDFGFPSGGKLVEIICAPSAINHQKNMLSAMKAVIALVILIIIVLWAARNCG